jgi:hypothetical protein
LGLQGIRLGALGGLVGKRVLKMCAHKNLWGFMTYYKNLPPGLIPLAHKFGIHFCPRVPDDSALVKTYIEANVDGFETDNIPFIRQCILEAGYTLPPLP